MSTQEFNSLVLNNLGGLHPFAVTLTRDSEAAKDLCQETLCKAFTHREKYRPGTNIKAWLYTIMRNIFINDYRRNNRKKEVFQVVGRQEQAPVSAETGIRLREIDEAIYRLPIIFKKACML
ncbi:MAG TPA: sigma-70 family RNA polymerase sigma factor, partial [Chitinophagaceae bacterium]|nr:sigma-70 family RNA polymerase sigma factor [Chitinophagaceae bacterium]